MNVSEYRKIFIPACWQNLVQVGIVEWWAKNEAMEWEAPRPEVGFSSW